MIDLLRQYPPAVRWLNSLGEAEIAIPGFVVMELIQGCKNKIEQHKVKRALEPYDVVWPSPETCDKALAVFSDHHLSRGIGILDAIIGQMATDLGLALHTFNQKHYVAVPNLRTVQPYSKRS